MEKAHYFCPMWDDTCPYVNIYGECTLEDPEMDCDDYYYYSGGDDDE